MFSTSGLYPLSASHSSLRLLPHITWLRNIGKACPMIIPNFCSVGLGPAAAKLMLLSGLGRQLLTETSSRRSSRLSITDPLASCQAGSFFFPSLLKIMSEMLLLQGQASATAWQPSHFTLVSVQLIKSPPGQGDITWKADVSKAVLTSGSSFCLLKEMSQHPGITHSS